MAYHRHYRRAYSSKKARQRQVGMERALQHINEYRALARRLGPIVDDIRKAFFGLSSSNIDRLLSTYGLQHGAKTENYARKTFGDWKSGQRKMSGQTAERLLNLVPKFLDFHQRYLMVSRLCDHHTIKRSVHVTISIMHPESGLSELEQHVEDFCDVDILKHLPSHVLETATWLHENDVVATRALLSQIDREKSENVRLVANKEMVEIRVLARRKDVSSVYKVIEFPTGTIGVTFKKPSLWEWIFG